MTRRRLDRIDAMIPPPPREKSFLAVVAFLAASTTRTVPTTDAFASSRGPAAAAVVRSSPVAIFPPNGAAPIRTTPSKEGPDIELPDFDALFGLIQRVSPLAKLAMEKQGRAEEEEEETGGGGRIGGFSELTDDEVPHDDDLPWKNVERNPRKFIHRIDRIDDFQSLGVPIFRFRSSLVGPCLGEKFADFHDDLTQRRKWDMTIDDVYQIASVYDLSSANVAMMGGEGGGADGKYGDCVRMGVGYTRTKANLVASAREQLTLCGVQSFPATGSYLIWGSELNERCDNLFPTDVPRQTRSKIHLFSVALVPTSDDTFDVEYCLQVDIGGNIPNWLSSPVLIETARSLFRYCKRFYGGEGGELDAYLKELDERPDPLSERMSILLECP